MITVPTVLILGAGASIPFEFPSGLRLRQQVCDFIQAQKPTDPSGLLPSLRLSVSTARRFRKALLYSGQESVDAFLEHRSEYIEIGKVAIANALARIETVDHLFPKVKLKLHWYDYLFKNLSTKVDDFEQNRLSVLTFNYDRSLEAYLITTLQNSYSLSKDDALDKLKSIPIIHLHGDLGEIDHRLPESRDYGADLDVEALKLCSKRIKIIHESVENDKEFVAAWKLLKKAERIYFIGFGYHQTNVKRLSPKDWGKAYIISGSAYEIRKQRRLQIKSFFNTSNRIILAPHEESETINFLEEHVALV